MLAILRAMLVFSLLIGAGSVLAAPGKLVIVGGALDPENAEIFRAFLDRRPAESPRIAIVPAASGEPAQSAERFAEDLAGHGVDRSDIAIVKLAVMDDPGTRGVDESKWQGNADRKLEIAKITGAGAIWFTGGDQARIVRALLERDGSETPMLTAIRKRLEGGAVVGGTSAGAAIMSRMMILCGDSLGALLPEGAGEKLIMGRGLGFLVPGLVDQHFGQRARLGRLALALGMIEREDRIGFGIDENTALVVDQSSKQAMVVGGGYVTVLDAREARYSVGDRTTIAGLELGIASQADLISLPDGEITPAEYKRKTNGREYFNNAVRSSGGMAASGYALAEVIGEALVDNKAAVTVERISFVDNYGVAYRFAQTENSRGWWGRGPDKVGRYTVSGINFTIAPMRVLIEQEQN